MTENPQQKPVCHSKPSPADCPADPKGAYPLRMGFGTPSRRLFWGTWMVSFVIHAGLVAGFVMVSRANSTAAPQPKTPPVSTFEQPSEALEVEPIVENLQIDTRLSETVRVDQPDLPPPVEDLPGPAVPDDTIAAVSDWPVSHDFEGLTIGAEQAYQSRFFTATGTAADVCFLVDCSGSMILAFDYVRAELKRAIGQLSPAQYFQVIFYAGGPPVELPGGELLRANSYNRQKAREFIDRMELVNVANSTAAWQAVVDALQAGFSVSDPAGRRVKLMYLLTDGEYEHQPVLSAVGQFQKQHPYRVTINVIACGNRDNEPFLRQLAAVCQGQYRFVSDEQLVKPSPNALSNSDVRK